MEKVIYLVWGDGSRPENGAGFEEEIVEAADRGTEKSGARGGSVHVARQDIMSKRLNRTDPPPESLWCMASVWLDDIIQRETYEQELRALNANRYDSYLVTESVPRWRPAPPSGKLSAGIQLLSILHRPDTMDHDEFTDYWINGHLPLSLSIHPQWTYVRNIITRPLNEDARKFDAVCEHGFEEAEHLLDPRYFYGAGSDPDKLAENQAIIAKDAAVFVDRDLTAAQTTVEYVLKPAFTPRALPGLEYAGPAAL